MRYLFKKIFFNLEWFGKILVFGRNKWQILDGTGMKLEWNLEEICGFGTKILLLWLTRKFQRVSEFWSIMIDLIWHRAFQNQFVKTQSDQPFFSFSVQILIKKKRKKWKFRLTQSSRKQLAYTVAILNHNLS